mgnify:CR=1 FL=1
MITGASIATAGQMLSFACQAKDMVDAALNFEHLSDTCLPQRVLFNLLKAAGVKPEQLLELGNKIRKTEGAAANKSVGAVGKLDGGSTSSAGDSMLEKHLPNEEVWSVDDVQINTKSEPDGSKSEKVTTLRFRTIEKDISSFVNFNQLIDTIKEGRMPSSQQIALALLDVVDMIDMGILGSDLRRMRLEPHVKERQITVTETITCCEDRNLKKINENLTQLRKKTETYQQEVTLSGENLPEKTLAIEEARQESTHYLEHSESRLSTKEKILGGNVEITERVYETTKTEHTRAELNGDGEMQTVFKEGNTVTDDISRLVTKEWRSGYISWVPLVGSGTEIVRKYQSGVKVTVDDWVTFGVDVVCVALMVVPGGQVGGAAMKGGASATRIAATQVRRGLSKAALKPGKAAGSLRRFYDNPRQVFSPERIAAKAKTIAHNPMKESMLKTLANLSNLEQNGVNVKAYLRKEFADMGAEGRLIADTLTRNLRYLKQNGWLTPENIARMEKGLNPIGYIKDAVTGAIKETFRLDVDHIIPKSLEQLLKAHPGNLVFLPQIDNILKSNNLMRHVVQHVERFLQVKPDWRPSAELIQKLREFMEAHPDMKGVERVRELLS